MGAESDEGYPLRPPSTPVSAYVGLGSNLGDRIVHLRKAVQGLAAREKIRVSAVSPVYETEAHTLDPDETQPPYLNAVVELQTILLPDELLSVCQQIEAAEGRVSSARRWAPRPLDLDLLTYEDVIRQSEHLTLPHPRLAERRFVLRPWTDLAPNLYVPSPFEATVAELLERCPDSSVLVLTEYDLSTALRSS